MYWLILFLLPNIYCNHVTVCRTYSTQAHEENNGKTSLNHCLYFEETLKNDQNGENETQENKKILGMKGQQGYNGTKGEKGETGPQGYNGTNGMKGEKGDPANTTEVQILTKNCFRYQMFTK